MFVDNGFAFAEKHDLCTEPVTVTSQQRALANSSCTVDIIQGSVTGYKDVSTVGERALMSAVARQPVSTTIEADQSSLQSYMSGVLCSRGMVPSVEEILVRS